MPLGRKPAPYAAKTHVPVGRSRQEIEQLLRKHGATRFGSFTGDTETVIGFSLQGLLIKITLPVKLRDSRQSDKLAAQAERSAWRQLLLVIKAKLEMVRAGISTVEREFLADIVLPNGTPVEAWLKPQLKAAFDHGEMPKQLSFGPSK